MGPRFTKLSAIFYGLLILASALWNGLRGRQILWLGDSIPISLLLGTLTAAATVALGVAGYRLLPGLRKLADEVAPYLIDRASTPELVLISIYSGIGEEVFFRGAVQPEFGLVVASLAFGLLHIGPDRRYLVWTFWAVGVGFLLGLLYQITNGLLAPIAAHSLHNAATFLLWKHVRNRRYGQNI